MKNNISKQPTGHELLQSYIDALTNIITSERAKYTAQLTESQLMQQMGSLGTNNGVYLTPDAIPIEQGDALLKESFNAHLTKVQSAQISQKSLSEIVRLQDQVKNEFIGKKITVEAVNKSSKPIDGVYLDKRTGQYRVGEYTARKFKGTIENIVFEENLLVLKPSFSARTVVPNRIYIHVYVLDLETMNPNVTINM